MGRLRDTKFVHAADRRSVGLFGQMQSGRLNAEDTNENGDPRVNEELKMALLQNSRLKPEESPDHLSFAAQACQ